MKTMPQSTKEEKYRWIKPVLDGEMSVAVMSKVSPFSQRTLKYWLAAFRKGGMESLENQSRRPRSHPNETPIRIKERVVELRKKHRQCALKIMWELAEEGVRIDCRTIGKILKTEGLTRKYRTKKIQYQYLKIPLQKGDLVEIDVKFVPELVGSEQYYQFTAIDCASRWRYLKIYPAYSNSDSVDFLETVIEKAPFRIRAVKTDNGANFTNRYLGYPRSADPMNPRIHAFDLCCQKHNAIHYLIDPGKPAQNGKVERSHRTDQERFYDGNQFGSLAELKRKIRAWNREYNNTRHCGLNGKTPNQVLGLP